MIMVAEGWEDVLRGAREELEAELPAFIKPKRWFRSKSRPIRSASIAEAVPVHLGEAGAYLGFLRVEYTDGEGEDYVLPLAFAEGPEGERLSTEQPHAVIARVTLPAGHDGVVYDAVYNPRFACALLDAIASGQPFRGAHGEVVASNTPELRRLLGGASAPEPVLLGAEQSNTSIRFGDRLILKLYRRLDEGTSLDLEIGEFLTEEGFPHAPAVAGALEHNGRTVAIVNAFIVNEGDAWSYALDRVTDFYETVGSTDVAGPVTVATTAAVLAAAARGPLPEAQEHLGGFLTDARLLGQRTAELHAALCSAPADSAFAPEPFTLFYQRSLYQSMRDLVGQVWLWLDRGLTQLPEKARAEAGRLAGREEELLRRFRGLVGEKIPATRIRTHGDYHLGQVLYTGKDFVITDFEGEPARPLSERRLKRSALRDVAGMVRSFHYAAYAQFFETTGGARRRDPTPALTRWADFWYFHASAAFVGGYLERSRGSAFLPPQPAALEKLLDIYLLEKAVYEVGYELNNRPDWLGIPVRGVLHLLGE